MSRSNSESQDGGAAELRSPSTRSVFFDTENGHFRDGRFKVSKTPSLFETRHYDGDVNNVRRGLRRSVSSNDVPRQFAENRYHVQRTFSPIGSRPNSIITKAEVLKKNIGAKNGNMVLQLVLPSNNFGSDPYLNNNSDENLENANNKRSSVGSNHDNYSTVGAEAYINQGFTPDLADYERNFAPQISVSETSNENNEQSTNIEVKKQNFRKNLTSILSSMYAIFIITLGLIIYVSDIINVESSQAESFSLYLVTVALLFILYVTVDIKMYVNKKNRYRELLKKNVAQEIEMMESPNGDYQLNIKLPEAIKFKELEHVYCFRKDRHSGNFYLKFGAAVFCVGHLIHSGLLLGYQILFLASDGEGFYECSTTVSLILDVLYPIYSFLLLYFIFKYSNIIINHHADMVRFALMHCLSTSLCFWVFTILRETVDSLSHHGSDHETTLSTFPISSTESMASTTDDDYLRTSVALPLTSYNKRGANVLNRYINVSVHNFVGSCANDAGMSNIYRNYSPYLYPFTVEYSILVVGVLFVIWQNIGKCKEKEEMSTTLQCDSPNENNDNLESNIVIHADCHSANKGLFGGIAIMVLTIVSVILFLIAVNDERYENGAVKINIGTSITIVLLMTISSIFAYRQMTKLDVNIHHHGSLLDELFLYICIPAFFLNGIVAIVPAVSSNNPDSIVSIVLEVAQVIVQTPLIIDGLRRSSNTKILQREKPGRELLTFLIVCNVSMWVMQTFEVKSHSLQDDRHGFYGEELWTIIEHLCVPLMMFYRFHSSVCIVDIWKYAYQPPGH